MGSGAKGQLIRLLSKSPLAQDVQAFIIDKEARGLSPRTIEFYADELRYWMAWGESQGVHDVQSATPDMVRRYLVALGKRRQTWWRACCLSGDPRFFELVR